MTMKLRILLLICVLLLFAWIIRQIRSRKLDLRYSLSWLAMGGVLILLVLFPGLLKWFAAFVGIQSQMNALFISGFAFALLIIFTLTAAVSRQSEEIMHLTQRVALLEKKIKDNDIQGQENHEEN